MPFSPMARRLEETRWVSRIDELWCSGTHGYEIKIYINLATTSQTVGFPPILATTEVNLSFLPTIATVPLM